MENKKNGIRQTENKQWTYKLEKKKDIKPNEHEQVTLGIQQTETWQPNAVFSKPENQNRNTTEVSGNVNERFLKSSWNIIWKGPESFLEVDGWFLKCSWKISGSSLKG